VFRELALERKKCLTIAQHIIDRYSKTKNEKDRASMTLYVNLASKIETYMNIMI
jgi:hypothetical protein